MVSDLDARRGYFCWEDLALFIGCKSIFRETVIEHVSDWIRIASSVRVPFVAVEPNCSCCFARSLPPTKPTATLFLNC